MNPKTVFFDFYKRFLMSDEMAVVNRDPALVGSLCMHGAESLCSTVK